MQEKTIPKNINEYIKMKEEQYAKEKELNSKFVSLQQGENVVKIDLSVFPTEIDSDFKDKDNNPIKRIVYQVQFKGQTKALSASKVLDRMIISCLAKGIQEITIIKFGTGKNTRYDIKELHN